MKGMKVVTLFLSKAKKGDLGFLMRTPEILEILRCGIFGKLVTQNSVNGAV